MERRAFMGACGCCGTALALGPLLRAGGDWTLPPRLPKPAPGTDEGGLWAMMDREEERLRKSPFLVKDPALNAYVHGVTCRLAKDHCPDVRTYVVRSPWFNANMAPNGMMQVWTGLLLRTENEAQLAAVLGHELGHYVARHSVARLRDAKSRSAFASTIAIIPVAGTLAAIGALAGGFAYSREHERAADEFGIQDMAAAGYPPMEASRVWANLLAELQAEKDWTGDASSRSVMFATHPTEKDRQAKLEADAKALGKADLNPGAAAFRQATQTWRRGWLEDELKRRKFGESLSLLGRLATADPQDGEVGYFLGEAYRLRASEGDLERALAAYQKAAAQSGAPPETYRALGVLHRRAGRQTEMREAYARYLELRPDAEDAEMIRSYLNQGEVK